MSYDPNFPPTNAPLISAQWRDQFHGIKDLIDAVSTVYTIVAFIAPEEVITSRIRDRIVTETAFYEVASQAAFDSRIESACSL